MNPSEAIEVRLNWLDFVRRGGALGWEERHHVAASKVFQPALEEGETFFMDQHFCALADHARRVVPDDLRFETSWMIRPAGFLYLEQPFEVPPIWAATSIPNAPAITVRAVGWSTVPAGTPVLTAALDDTPSRIAARDSIYFRCFIAARDIKDNAGGFLPWSYFVVESEAVKDRIDRFEGNAAKAVDPGSEYVAGREAEALHEIRWVYAAMHLMAQRLSTRIRRNTDRAARRRIERNRGRAAPPFIEVVTLRRLATSPRRPPAATPTNWNWQWDVRGHWRNQWYPKERVHKQTFIESYVKGPPDKPFKASGVKLFVARR